MKRLFAIGATGVGLLSVALSQGWQGAGGNAQHNAPFSGASQSISKIHWQAPMDDDPSYYAGVVFAHFASPMISPSNTVVFSHRQTTTVNGQPNYDNWWMYGAKGGGGAAKFYFHTDYSAPLVWPTDWTTELPMSLVQISNGKGGTTTAGAVAGAGGSVFVRQSVDQEFSPAQRYVFYTTLQDYTTNAAAYSSIKIVTPLTADHGGNLYFGYQAGTSTLQGVEVGTGGVVKLNAATGAATFVPVAQLGVDSSISRPAYEAAPALSNDGTSVYFGMTGTNGGYLVKLSTADLTLQAQVHLIDPSIPGAPAQCHNDSSSSPMVAPDGRVFYGVFGNQWRESHGFLLQFDANLSQKAASGKNFPVGAFGWDDTPSIVPSSIVPSYSGSSPYLLLCKYNNYDDNAPDPGADGSNRVAILDPGHDGISRDRQSGIHVMNEVITVLGPTKTNNDSSHPDAVNEWCINSAVIDVPKKSAIVNSEDGHVYRWDFTTNTLKEGLMLQPPTGEAYTSTIIGPDGQIYAMNNTILFALGN